MRSVAVWDAEILFRLGVVEVHGADIARVLPDGELPLVPRLLRIGCVDPAAENMRVVSDVLDADSVRPDCALHVWHEIQAEPAHNDCAAAMP